MTEPVCVDAKCVSVPASSEVEEAVLIEILENIIEEAVEKNCRYLCKHPGTPNLYDTAIRYIDDSGETDRQNIWTIPEVGKRGQGACADLAAWRCAELRVYADLQASRVTIQRQNTSRANPVFHALVSTPRGFEDPSTVMKMRNR